MNNSYLRGIYLRLAGVVTLVVTLALVANAFLSQRSFEATLAPQMAGKLTSVGASIRSLVQRAVLSGVDFREMYGVTERFAAAITEAPEITYIALTDPQGQVLHQSKKDVSSEMVHFMRGTTALELLKTPESVSHIQRVGEKFVVAMSIHVADQPLGVLHIGVHESFFNKLVLDMIFDVLVVLVVALFFTLELLHFIAGAKLETSLRKLGSTFERGAAGDFRAHSADHSGAAFGSLLRLMDATLARINQAYSALARDVEQGRRVPAHERHPGLAAAQNGLQSLASRFKFGGAQEDAVHDDSHLSKIRAPLFMFILAEELTRSFLPSYVNELLVPVPGISSQFLIGLPIALFMLIVAIGQPFLGVYCDRVGHRRTMLIGAGIAAVGMFASSVAGSVIDLLIWRSLCAIGYAMVFVAGQAYVLEHASPSNKAKSFALFVGAIMAATICGPSIGGILADNIGMRPTFAIAALLAAGSMLVIQGLPGQPDGPRTESASRLPRLAEIGALMMNARFMAVTGLAAMPAKILLTGVCFYLSPLSVVSIGDSQAMAGRILMTYAVVMVVLAPLTAGLATSRERMHWLVGGGLAVSGLGGMLLLAGAGVGWVFLAVILIGLGQSMSISAQSALVSEHCGPEIERLGDGVVYGVYRLLERLGNAAGPMLAAALLVTFDHRTSFAAIGALVVACGALFMFATRNAAKPALVTV